ncbi:MAG: succinate dehydrogenase assembly factor 4 [Pseudomonadota bacterium]
MADDSNHNAPGTLSEEERQRRAGLSKTARLALEEADRRRAVQEAELAKLEAARGAESGGPTKIEPTRYGDWERKGIAYDF